MEAAEPFDYMQAIWHSRATEEQAVDAAADVTQIRFVAAVEFDNGAAGVPNFRESFAHGRPVHVAVAQVDPRVSVFLALKVFEMHVDDALAQRANPFLRVAVKH